jgi:hypothetical protein
MRVLLQPDGTWALHGLGGRAEYEYALRALKLRNDGPVPDFTVEGQRTLRVEVFDASGLPAVLTRPVAITPPLPRPVVTLVGSDPLPAVAGEPTPGRLAAGDPYAAVPLNFVLLCPPLRGNLSLSEGPGHGVSFVYTSLPSVGGLDTFVAEFTNQAGRTTVVATTIDISAPEVVEDSSKSPDDSVLVDRVRVWTGRNSSVFLSAPSLQILGARIVVTSETNAVSLALADARRVQPGSTRRSGLHPVSVFAPLGVTNDAFDYAVVVEGADGSPSLAVLRRRVEIEVVETSTGSSVDLELRDLTLRMDARPGASGRLESSFQQMLVQPLANGAQSVEYVVVSPPMQQDGGRLSMINSTAFAFDRGSGDGALTRSNTPKEEPPYFAAHIYHYLCSVNILARSVNPRKSLYD